MYKQREEERFSQEIDRIQRRWTSWLPDPIQPGCHSLRCPAARGAFFCHRMSTAAWYTHIHIRKGMITC